jgi:FkbM family methyltransferase
MFARADDRFITPELVSRGTWEPAEAKFLRRVIRTGDVVVDCGANVGYFTLLAAHAVGPNGAVLAVEPQPINCALLRANVWRQRLGNVVVLPTATGARRGLIALDQPQEQNSGSYEGRSAWGEDDQLIPMVPVDDVMATAGIGVDVVKIDVQGADHEVLAGVQHALAGSPHAVVLVEFWPEGMERQGADPAAVLASYRASSRPIGLLRQDGNAVSATDEDIMSACTSWEGGFANVILGPTSSRQVLA